MVSTKIAIPNYKGYGLFIIIGTSSVEFSWTPTADQYGPQGFCLGVIDNTMVQSDSWCLTFLVGVSAPTLQSPHLIPGSGFPTNSVETNHSVFYIKSKKLSCRSVVLNHHRRC